MKKYVKPLKLVLRSVEFKVQKTAMCTFSVCLKKKSWKPCIWFILHYFFCGTHKKLEKFYKEFTKSFLVKLGAFKLYTILCIRLEGEYVKS